MNKIMNANAVFEEIIFNDVLVNDYELKLFRKIFFKPFLNKDGTINENKFRHALNKAKLELLLEGND